MDRLLFSTRRLKIRNLKDSDLDAFYQYRSNPEVTRYQGFSTITRDRAKAFIEEHGKKTFIKPGEWIQFGIEIAKSQQLIGDCAIYLHHADSRIAETGITISHLYQRQGFAKETMTGLINYLFREKGIHRLVETVDAENKASIHLMQSLLFRQEGHFIENIFFKGKWGSELQFAMLKREWQDLYVPNT